MFFTRFLRQTFHKPSISLLIGLIAAQLITLLWSPILTRLYSPASFALLSVFMASIGIFGNLACWKLEMSVVTREHEEDIWYVAVLSLIAAVLTALLLTTIIFVFFKTTYQ